ncbi:MAG: MATE family efflux transporter [Clostridia bacterium]|nr:MATE family efflux transporter [Clostridia bacterium]
MDRSVTMQEGNIGSLLWKFSLPAIVGMLINALYNIVDRIFVGRGVGDIAIAATTVAFPIMIIMMSVAILIGIGTTALISIRLGEQKKDEAEKVVGNGVIMLVVLPLILTTIFMLFAGPILTAFGAEGDVFPYALDFTRIIMLGAVFGALTMGMNNFIRAEGNPTYAMATQITGGLINIALNYVFIFKVGLGIKGSALATVCAQTISTLMVLYYYLSGRSLLKIRLKNLKPQLPVLTSIVTIGFAPFAMQLANSIQQMILNKSLYAYGGDMALSALGIMMSVATLLLMPLIGLSQGAQPLIGYNYGARQYDRVKETLFKAVVAGTCIALVFYLVIHIWPEQIVGLFSKDNPALIQMTSQAMMVYFAMLPILAFQILGANYFQAVGKPVQSTILSLSRQVLLFIPLLLILPRFWGIDGIWRTAPIADALSVLLTASLIAHEMKNLPKIQPQSIKQQDRPSTEVNR